MDNTQQKLKQLRKEIDQLDKLLMHTLKKRFSLVNKVAKLKQKVGMPIVQKNRWNEMLERRIEQGQKNQLDSKFIKTLMTLIHKESCRIQNQIVKKVKNDKI